MKKLFTLSLFLFATIGSFAQVTVNSLQELKTYLDQDNVNIKLAPGTYSINAADIASGAWGYEVPHIEWARAVIQFAGSNSTYDFTDVTLNIDTDVFTAFGNLDIWTFHNMGNDNVFKNLTMIDDGSVHDAPRRGVTNVVIDGRDNVMDGFDVNSKGSYPYGYSEIFGKGPNNTISTRKHSGILIRGTRNTLKNTTLLHQAFGHCVFMQAADSPTIENCYIQGEVRSTDDILAEEGTGSLADEMEFMTTWGYKLPTGYMLALCEEGIRSYNAGETLIDGEFYSRGSSDITVLNSTVKNSRVGVSLTLASGSRHVENVTVLGSEVGFSLRGPCIDCKADCIYGPVYQSTYDSDSWDADITILPPSDAYYNGGKCIAYIGSNNCDVTLRSDGNANIPADYEIRLGGLALTKSFLLNQTTQENHRAQNVTLMNYTSYPIDIVSGSNDNNVTTCGVVTDEGSGNSVNYFADCNFAPIYAYFDAFDTIQAEDFCSTEGASKGDEYIGSIFNGDWVLFENVNFGTGTAFGIELNLAKAHDVATHVEIHLDGMEGTPIATVEVPNTGAWTAWETVIASIEETSGTHDVYLVFTSTDENEAVANVESFLFLSECELGFDAYAVIEAEDFCDMLGIEREASTENGENIGYINNGDWISFSNVDFGSQDTDQIEVRVACNFTGGEIEIRTGSETGALIGTLPVVNTGGNQNWVTLSADLDEVSGLQDVYLVFTGGDGYLFNVNYLEFKKSLVTSLDAEINKQLEVYPNPTTGIVNLSNFETYQVSNSFDQIVLSGEGNQVDLNNQNKGIYILKIGTNIIRIIKQ